MVNYKILSIEVDGQVYDLRNEPQVRQELQQRKKLVKHIITEKVCYRCKQEKPMSEFFFNRATKDGYQIYCKPCQTEFAKASKMKSRLIVCNGCGVTKDKKEYYRGEHTCKVCRAKKVKLAHLIAVKKITEAQNIKPELSIYDVNERAIG